MIKYSISIASIRASHIAYRLVLLVIAPLLKPVLQRQRALNEANTRLSALL